MPKINCDNKQCDLNKNKNCTIDILSLVNGECEYAKVVKESLRVGFTEDKDEPQSEASKQLDAMHKDMASGNYLDQMEHNREVNE
jgi:hypothetical protein